MPEQGRRNRLRPYAVPRHSLCRVPVLLLLGCLTGCGHDPADRTTGGAAAGAGTGALIGLIGGPVGVVAGALIGGGAGAISGATVPEKHLDLGPPPWSGAPH